MDFIIENSALFITIGVVAIVLVLGLYVTPLLKKSGIVKEEDLTFTGQILELLTLVVGEVKFRDEETKEKATTIIKIAELAVKHVQNMMSDATIEEKRGAANIVTLAALNQLKIEATESRKKLISVVIYNAIK